MLKLFSSINIFVVARIKKKRQWRNFWDAPSMFYEVQCFSMFPLHIRGTQFLKIVFPLAKSISNDSMILQFKFW